MDISKAFDKFWHDGLIFTLKAYGIKYELLSLLDIFYQNREERLVLNGQTSEWRKINSGVPQGSVLGPLIFLIYINDLPDGLTSICKVFSDDTSLFPTAFNIYESANDLNTDLEKISRLACQCKLQIES